MSTDFFFIPLIINLIILAYVKYNYSDYLKLVLLSTFNYQSSVLLWKENKNNKARSFYFLLIIFFISISLFVFAIFQSFFQEFTEKYILFIIPITLFTIGVLINLNKIANYFSGKIFIQEELSSEYNSNINIFNQSVGLILFPITILIYFTKATDFFVYTGIVMFFLIYFLKIIRLFKININKQLNILYMFLYLCTLEIIPLIYLYKVVKHIIGIY